MPVLTTLVLRWLLTTGTRLSESTGHSRRKSWLICARHWRVNISNWSRSIHCQTDDCLTFTSATVSCYGTTRVQANTVCRRNGQAWKTNECSTTGPCDGSSVHAEVLPQTRDTHYESVSCSIDGFLPCVQDGRSTSAYSCCHRRSETSLVWFVSPTQLDLDIVTRDSMKLT